MNAIRNTSVLRVLTVVLLLSVGRASAQDQPYDPLAACGTGLAPSQWHAPETLNLTINDGARRREIPIRIYLPAEKAPAPVVLFSHGLGGSREGYAYLGKHWAARGYVAVFLQHPGSDTSVWQDKPLAERMAAMQQAANFENFMLRVQDVPAVLDQLEQWNASTTHELCGRLDLKHVGMAGHSFGAVTTQAVSGQGFVDGAATFTDPRITAAIALSPSLPRAGSASQAFGAVKIPWLLMTGTKDVGIIAGSGDPESRMAVFPALPAGNKYELVLDRAEHSAFSDRALPGDTEKRNPNHHRAILALSTAFWDAWLRGDPSAKSWLNGDGPRSVLEEHDRWQKK